MSELVIETLDERGLPGVVRLYNEYVRDSYSTFEEVELSVETMRARLQAVRAVGLPWIVLRSDADAVLGYAYARPFHERSAYRFAAEVSVYVEPSALGQRFGTRLYLELIQLLQKTHVTQLLALIALPNPASVRLHEAMSFAHAGTLRRVGFKHGQWIDVGYFQRSLEPQAQAELRSR